jgi:hypothetical protein
MQGPTARRGAAPPAFFVLCLFLWGLDMRRFSSIAGFLLIITASAHGIENPSVDNRAAAAKAQARVMSDAFIKADYEVMIDKTYPPLIDLIGGREKYLEMLQSMEAQMAARELKIVSIELGTPGPVVSHDDLAYVVLPSVREMSIPAGKLISDTYFLGISSDQGVTWTFLEGSGMANEPLRQRLLPNLPAELKLPEPTEPRFVENE